MSTSTASPPAHKATPEEPLIHSPAIALVEINNRSVLVYDPLLKTTRKISSNVPGSVTLVGWSVEGCGLIVSSIHDLRGDVVEVDFEGGVVNSIASYDFSEVRGVVADVTLSSDWKWIAYLVGTGQALPSRYEFQDIYVSRIGEDVSYTRITHGGISRKPAWSPLRQLLAFVDIDVDSQEQVFLYEAESAIRTQLTIFTANEKVWQGPVWAPDGRSVVIATYSETEGADLIVIDLSGPKPISRIITHADLITDIEWLDSKTVLAYVNPSGYGLPRYSGSIQWIRSDSGALVFKLAEKALLPAAFHEPKPIMEGFSIGFFTSSGFFTYDPTSEVITKIATIFIEVMNWVPGSLVTSACPK